MGCVNSEATSDKRRNSSALTQMRDSMGNPLSDVEAARRKDEKYIEKKLSKQVEDINKKNEELNRQLTRLKKQNEVKKKQSMQSMESKDKQMKRLEEEKNRQIEKLKKELEKEKNKSKQNKGTGNIQFSYQGQKDDKSKQQKAVGLVSLEKNKALCQQCFYKLPRYTETNPSLSECFSCRGYGLVQERFPYGAKPSCDKALCFNKGWEKVKSMRLCSVCQGKGGQEPKVYPARRF